RFPRGNAAIRRRRKLRNFPGLVALTCGWGQCRGGKVLAKVATLQRLSLLAIVLLAVAGPLAACDGKKSTAEKTGEATQNSTTTTGTTPGTTTGTTGSTSTGNTGTTSGTGTTTGTTGTTGTGTGTTTGTGTSGSTSTTQ